MTLVHGDIQLFRSQERFKICPFSEMSRPALVPAKPHKQMVKQPFLQVTKRTCLEYKHLPLSISKFYECLQTYLPDPAICLNDINRISFNFTILKSKVMQLPTSK
jgi:hypothetical protein